MIGTNQTKLNTPKKQLDKNNVLGLVGGAGAGFISRQGFAKIVSPYYTNSIKNLDKFTIQEQDLLIQEASRMIEESGITKKGFKGINWIAETKQQKANGRMYSNEALKKMTKELSELKPTISKSLKIALSIVSKPIKDLAGILTGKTSFKKTAQRTNSLINGCFSEFTNSIFTAKPASVFHEIGHAINKNNNFFIKIPKNLAMLSMLVLTPLAIITAVVTDKPKKEVQNRSLPNKLKNFIHKNIGLTVVGLSLPLLVEEGMASMRATKFINNSKILSQSVKNQHSKVLKLAFGSYLITSALLASVASIVVFTKDKIVAKNLPKLQ